MTFVVLSLSGLVFVLVLLLFYGPAKKSDRKSRRINYISGGSRNELDEELETPFFQRFLFPAAIRIMKNISRLLPKNKGSEAQKTEKLLLLARINLSVNEWKAARLMFSGAFIIGTSFISLLIPIDFTLKVLIDFIGLIISLITPIYVIKYRISSRQEGIRNQLADVMDLLSVTIEAGLGFDSALVKIGERLDGPLVDELNAVLIEIQLGKPRREALKSLADRSSLDELKTFVSSIVQAEQLGIPIKNVLRSQAVQIRNIRRQKAEATAMKAPVKMMLPLVLFIFPVLFIILLGPTVLQIIKQFGGG